MAVVLHSSHVFVIAKTRHEQIDKDVYLFMRYLLLIFAKAPFPIVIFSEFFSLYGGLLHFVFYSNEKTKCSTALSACIFLPLLLCFRGVFPLTSSKPRKCITRAAKRISASIAVRGTTFPISIYSSHTAVTRSMGKRVYRA